MKGVGRKNMKGKCRENRQGINWKGRVRGIGRVEVEEICKVKTGRVETGEL